MARVPKWIADAMESVLSSKYLSVVVSFIEIISPEIRKVCFKGDFRTVDFFPGYAVAFRVTENDFRNYTPSRFDREAGICEVLFHLHGRGPGSRFAAGLMPGDQLKMVIPRGHKVYRPDKEFHFFFGDESSLGLFSLMAGEAKIQGRHYMGVLEMSEKNLMVPALLDLKLKTVLKISDAVGQNAIAGLNMMKNECPYVFHGGVFYLAGNVASIQQLKKALRQLDVSPKQIVSQAYWAEGKIGL